ncbi:hypothetical protein BN130_2031 [Cronobacter malonaticus 507]|nr:hypothetical protein BN130_2031 [Cronobacter malonaticus 507]
MYNSPHAPGSVVVVEGRAAERNSPPGNGTPSILIIPQKATHRSHVSTAQLQSP